MDKRLRINQLDGSEMDKGMKDESEMEKRMKDESEIITERRKWQRMNEELTKDG